MIYVTAINYVKMESVQEYKILAKELVKQTNEEEGCISYKLTIDMARPNKFVFIEIYKSMKDLQAHFESEHFKELVPKMSELLTDDPNVIITTEVK